MAKLKQPFDEPRVVPWLGHVLVNPGEVVTVDDSELGSWLEGGWEPADAATRKAGKKLLDDGVITVLVGVTDAEPVTDEGAPAGPAGTGTES